MSLLFQQSGGSYIFDSHAFHRNHPNIYWLVVTPLVVLVTAPS